MTDSANPTPEIRDDCTGTEVSDRVSDPSGDRRSMRSRLAPGARTDTARSIRFSPGCSRIDCVLPFSNSRPR